MSTMSTDSAAFTALLIAVKASMLFGLAALAQWAVHRRASAATRHLVWTLAVASVLLLPLLWVVLPNWSVAIRTSAPLPAAKTALSAQHVSVVDPISVPSAVVRPSAALATDRDSAPGTDISALWLRTGIGSVYVFGVLAMLASLVVQHRMAQRFVANATLVRDPEWLDLLGGCAAFMGVGRPVRLLRSRAPVVPLTIGLNRPVIVIPADAETWAEDRRRAVILHELAHVARHDCLTQTLACVARALYWFNPVAWWVARRLRIERELACDDRVIAAGTAPREYAGHLLEIAYSLGGQRAPALSVGMARPDQLEGRMLAALDGARNRRAPTFRIRAAAVTLTAALLGTIAGATPAVLADSDAVRVQDAVRAAAADRALLAPSLDPVEWPFVHDARRLIRDAAAIFGLAEDDAPGTWELRPAGTAGTVHLRLVEPHSSHGSDVALARLEGLDASQLTGAGGPVRFRMRRDAGTFEFEGVVRNGVGAGTFSFTPDQAFAEALAKRGFARPQAREQYELARSDIGHAFLDELVKQGYAKPGTPELVRAGQHGVQTAYLREMGALGYRLGSLEPLITLRDHGVTPDYVRELASLGYKDLPADDLRRARDHGITPDYVQGMREAGYAVAIDALIGARDHGVTVQFVRELRQAGHDAVPLEQLIRVRDHGVTPEYVRDLRKFGYAVSLDELARTRDHGVTPDYIGDLAALGYSSLPLESLIRLRDHGVTPQYAQELKALGYDRLAPEDLVTLRDHGLTPDRIRAANTRAGARLPVDQLKAFANGTFR